MVSIVTLFALVGCGHCPEGYSTGADGQCVAETAKEGENVDGDGQLLWSEIAASIPACAAEDAGSELDIGAGCVDGVCIGATESDVSDAFGSDGTCSADECAYPNGVTVEFVDGVVAEFSLASPYAGRDENGLGVGVGIGCFVDQFASPDAMTTYLENGVVGIWSLHWYDAGLSVFDDDAFGADLGDWIIDTVYIDGAGN